MIMEIGIDTIIIRLLLACFIGGIIGYEREKHNRAAGFRTHILVCVGACIISLIEMRMEEEFLKTYYEIGVQNVGIQLTRGRLAAQVISGIGFLGAGTIMFHKGSIKGLTTAASLWVVGCLGIAVGYGQTWVACIGVTLSLCTLYILASIQNRFINKNSFIILDIICLRGFENETNYIVQDILFNQSTSIDFMEIKEINLEESLVKYKIKFKSFKKLHILINKLRIQDYIVSVDKKIVYK